MDLMAGATVLAQIVSLIAIFSGERASGKIDQKQDFLAWLVANNHEELRRLLENNKQAVAAIEALLSENQQALLARLANIDEMLAKMLSRTEGFRAIVTALNPAAELSEQAVNILRQLDRSGASGFSELKNMRLGHVYFYLNAKGSVEYSDKRFLDDDLATLVELGLLRLDYGSDGSRIFRYTRTGAGLLRTIDAGRSGM